MMTIKSTQLPDEDALCACLIGVSKGCRLAFSTLYDLTCGVLYTTSLKMMRHKTEAEDVFQDSMVKVWNKADRFDPNMGSAMAWLLTITRNTARDRLRSIKRKAIILPRVVEFYETQAAPFESPNDYDDLFKKEKSLEVTHALQRLPKPERDAISLNFLKGLSSSEVADALGAPLGTVKSRIRRGLLKLRSQNLKLAHLA